MSGPTPGLPARRAALRAIARVEDDGAWSTLAVPDAIAHLDEQRDRSFAAHLAHDTLRWDGTLRWLLGNVVTRAEVEVPIDRILRLGALQLFRSAVPARAAVDTSVRLAREAVPRNRAEGAARFVNGVLRNLDRALQAGIDWPSDERRALALQTGHPTWIVADVLGRLEEPAALLEADNDPPGLTLRANVPADALVAELLAEGVDARAIGDPPEAVAAPGADPRRLAAVARGDAVPQDAASMLIARSVRAGPGDRVLDLCAGPGGKATHLAQLVGPTGHVTAVELHDHRARLVVEAARRQGVDVEVVVGDARVAELGGPYDAVLLDAPCSGLGVGRRRPEVRWRQDPASVNDLARLQRQLLDRARGLVAVGGHLTYAVCTWTRAETEDVAADLASDDRFEEVERRLVRPDVDGTDAMFWVTWRCRR